MTISTLIAAFTALLHHQRRHATWWTTWRADPEAAVDGTGFEQWLLDRLGAGALPKPRARRCLR